MSALEEAHPYPSSSSSGLDEEGPLNALNDNIARKKARPYKLESFLRHL